RAIWIVNGVLLLIVVLWTVPTVGLLVSSIRQREDIQSSGWWSVFPHQQYVPTGDQIPLPTGQTRDKPITINGVSATFDQWKSGVNMPDGTRLVWVGNLRLGHIDISRLQWVANLNFTLDNYTQVLGGKTYEIRNADGTTTTVQGENLVGSFINSLTVAIPSTI